MVFSPELGYDPDEWEECSEDSHFMVFGFFTRMFLSITTVSLMCFLLWFIEVRKRWDQKATLETTPNEQKVVKQDVREFDEKPGRRIEMSQTEMEPIVTEAEQKALEDWHRELAKLEELRMKELRDHISDGSLGISEIETESQLIDHLAPADEISMRTDFTETEQQLFRESQGASSSLGTYTTTYSSRPIRDKLDREIQKIEALAKEEQYFDEYANESSNGNDWERISPGAIAMDVNEPDEDRCAQFPSVDARKINQKESTDSDEGFVKIWVEESGPKPVMIQSIDTHVEPYAEPVLSRQSTHPEEEIKELKELFEVYNVKTSEVLQMKLVGLDKGENLVTSAAQEERLMEEKDQVVQEKLPEITSGTLNQEEARRLAEADIYIHDAIEYVDNQRLSDTFSGFVVEEDMLESIGKNGDANQIQRSLFSGEATSQIIKTNEIGSIQRQPVPMTRIMRGQSPSQSSQRSGRSMTSSEASHALKKQSSLLSVLGVTSTQEMLLTLTSLEALSAAMSKAGLESTNLIFGIDYTASNKYQGEHCFGGRSLHSTEPGIQNPYQQVISIMCRTLAPFASSDFIPAYGFGDAKTGDWSVFKLRPVGECQNLAEVLEAYNAITPTISLSGPTNFAPLIYQAIEICEQVLDYHILVIIADGQVTNERATRKAIVKACNFPLSIIVVGVGDGPWDMMRIFDDSLPKRPWDNFHFVELNEIIQKNDADSGELSFAIHSLLEIPDQYNIIKQLRLIRGPKGKF